MKVTFVLPGSGNRPVGGYRVAYEHASGLSRAGHTVCAVHAPLVQPYPSLALYVATVFGYRGGVGPGRWMQVDPAVQLLWRPTLKARWIPDADVVIATAWQTAEWVREYPPTKGRKFYFIHDYEHFMSAGPLERERIAATFRAGMQNIITSPAGREMLTACGVQPDACVPNGIDFRIFRRELNAADPERRFIGFPYRTEPFKGTRDAVVVLEAVRQRLGAQAPPVWAWGWEPRPELPDWVSYHQSPSDTLLALMYNRSKILLIPSHYEGWGLPGAEAMACGAALVSTDNLGVRAYAEHRVTAWLAKPRDTDALFEGVQTLLEDDQSRVALSERGYEHIRRFTWEAASAALNRVISSTAGVLRL